MLAILLRSQSLEIILQASKASNKRLPALGANKQVINTDFGKQASSLQLLLISKYIDASQSSRIPIGGFGAVVLVPMPRLYDSIQVRKMIGEDSFRVDQFKHSLCI